METLKNDLLRLGLEMGELISVPDYDGVQAGLPTEADSAPCGESLIPYDLVKGGTIITITVHGESMIDYDIREGDRLILQLQPVADCGDIVIARINGACTVKTFFEDECGIKWLIPGNLDFSPIRLNPDDDNHIVGVVKQIIHESPRVSYRDCVRAIRQYTKEDKKVVRNADIARALKAAIATMENRGLTGSRPWFAVYRTFTDKEIIEKGDYAGFVSLLDNIMGDEAPSISTKDMKTNLDVMSFAGPVSMWVADDAPVSVKRFYDYLEVAKATKQALTNR